MHSGQPRQIIGIDLIRAAAATMVMFYHLSYWDWTTLADPNATVPKAFVPLVPVTSAGWVGVEIFFVLSGFVIAYSTEGATPVTFFRRRFDRLVPSAILCATVTATVLVTAYPIKLVSILWLKSVIFFPIGPWVDGAYWTLPVEIAFYVVILASLCIQQGRYLSRIVAAVGMVSTTVCVGAVIASASGSTMLADQIAALSSPPWACLLLLHGCFFALGVFLFLVLVHRATSPSVRPAHDGPGLCC